MSNVCTLDDVLFEFQRTVKNPSPSEVTKWVQKYPEFADDIRAYVVELIDMEALASISNVHLVNENHSILNSKNDVESNYTLRDVIGAWPAP